jgi:hypothetical protein
MVVNGIRKEAERAINDRRKRFTETVTVFHRDFYTRPFTLANLNPILLRFKSDLNPLDNDPGRFKSD